MKVAFDIDGTLTIPAIRDLANTLVDNGATVYVITGGLWNQSLPWKDDMEGKTKHRKAQLEMLGVRYSELIICVGYTTSEVGAKKAGICRTNEIPIMFEDSDEYISKIRDLSDTLVLDVRNGKVK